MQGNVVKVAAWLALAAGLGLAAGCNQQETPFRKIDPNRLPITGEVTLYGKPLDGGFISLEATQKGVVSSGADVNDGKFQMDAADGLVPGIYLVKVYDKKLLISDPGASTDADEKKPRLVIPEQFNEKSKIKVEVKAGTNHFKIELK